MLREGAVEAPEQEQAANARALYKEVQGVLRGGSEPLARETLAIKISGQAKEGQIGGSVAADLLQYLRFRAHSTNVETLGEETGSPPFAKGEKVEPAVDASVGPAEAKGSDQRGRTRSRLSRWSMGLLG